MTTEPGDGVIEYGQPCKRCHRPMVPQHNEPPEGWAEHQYDGFCDACRKALGRPTIRRAELLDSDGIVDEVAVRRAADGETDLHLTTGELRAAVRHLATMGCSDLDIAHRLGMPVQWVRMVNNPGEVAA